MPPKYPKIALYDPSGRGGIAQYTFGLAEGLAQANVHVTLITCEGYELQHLDRSFDVWLLFRRSWIKPWIAALSTIVRRPRARQLPAGTDGVASANSASQGRFTARLRTLRVMLKLFRAAIVLSLNRTDVVHFQWLIDRRAELLFMRLLRLLRIKIVYTVHDVLPHDAYTAENRRFYQSVYERPDRLILHAESYRKEMLELFRVHSDNLCVIPAGCLGAAFGQRGESAGSARQRIGLPEDAHVVLFFGLIKRYKGLEYLLEAFDIIGARCSNAILLIGGSIADGDPSSRDYYAGLLAHYANSPAVRFCDGYVPLSQMADYFYAADVVVLPHVKASQSGVLLAAFAAGKPVVVTDTGGPSEVVKASESGFVVAPRDAKAIAAAVIAMFENPDLRRNLGAQAKRLAETTYSWKRIARTTASLYEALVQTGADSAAARAPWTL